MFLAKNKKSFNNNKLQKSSEPLFVGLRFFATQKKLTRPTLVYESQSGRVGKTSFCFAHRFNYERFVCIE